MTGVPTMQPALSQHQNQNLNTLNATKTSTLDDGEVADVDVNISQKTLIEED